MAADASPPPTARERARQALRLEITDQALALIAERGFDSVTTDEIASAVGVSRRTLFRLFATKEDVVAAAFERLGEDAVAALRARPADEPAWDALRRAFDPVVQRLERRPESFFAVHAVIGATPALRRRVLEQRDGWRVDLANALGGGLRSELLATAAIGAFDVASDRWARAGGRRRLGTLLDEAFALLGSGLAGR